jgi:Mg2+ and Co2+ transporter CorA
VDVRWVARSGLERKQTDDLSSLLARSDGFLWVDVTQPDEAAEALGNALGVPSAVMRDLAERTMVPKVASDDAVVVLILHSLDAEGHLLQLGQVVGRNFLVTVHGPLTAGVSTALALAETDEVAYAIERGDLQPDAPSDASIAIVTTLAESLEGMLASAAAKAGALDRKLRQAEMGDPETFLDELFSVRHELLTVANRAAQTREACATMAAIAPAILGEQGSAFEVLRDRFDRLRSLCEGEKEFLQGVLDYYESQLNTKMNIAMARLAVIAAVTLPVTAIGGILGMNTIVSAETNLAQTIVILVVMAMLGGIMLLWAKRKGWW